MEKPENLNSSLSNQSKETVFPEIKQDEKETKNPKKDTGATSNEKKQNICKICKKSFSTSGNMRNHIITIHENYRPFKCNYPGCKKEYSIESRYLVHLRTHKGEKPFICKICNKSFNEKGNLKTHLRFHSELRPFKCQFCNKSYKTNGHLKDHIDIKHRKIKKYNCEYCNKKFGRISTLKAHNRTHTGEKNYKCKLEGCNKCFAEKGNMEMHYQRHLKKLNKNINENIIKKKYGKKEIEDDYEKKIKEALDGLNMANHRKDITTKNDSIKVNHKKSSHAIFVNVQSNNNSIDDSNFNYSKETIKNENFVNKDIFNFNLNNVNINPKSDNINDSSRIINENNFKDNVNSEIKNNSNLNNYSNNEQNFEKLGNENQNNIGCFGFYSLIQDFNQMDPLNAKENKTEYFLKKESNEINYDFSNCVTRPESKNVLCMNKSQNEIFAREEDLFSEDEDDKDNDSKNMSDNSFLNGNSNMHFNQKYDFLDNQQNFLSDNKMNIFAYNFNNMSEVKNIKGQEFLDKNYMI